MAGMPGRSGGHGRNRKPLREHLLAGTYRPDRHAHLTAVSSAAPAGVTDWRPRRVDVQALGPQARALLTSTLKHYVLSESEGLLALNALRSLSLAEKAEARIAEEGLTILKHSVDGAGVEHQEPKAHPLLTTVARERRLFASLWAGLRLEK
jgi:hypothetical protein